MSHEVETMAFANEVPWHGLGHRVNPDVTIEEMLAAAGLNWEVDKHQLYADVDGEHVKVPGRYALRRSTDGRVLTITGESWKPLQNRDALEFFREYTFAGGAKLETAGSLRNGKIVWGLANLGHGFTIGDGDHVKGYLLFFSPHEVGKAISVRVTEVRVVCANTMAMAMGREAKWEYSQNHLQDFNFDKAREAIGLAHEQMVQAELDAQALNQLKMSEFDTVRFLAKFFQPVESTKEAKLLLNPDNQNRKLQEVLASVNEAPGATPGTGWGVLNGITHWSDHVVGRSPDTRMLRSWLGDNSRMKQQAKGELLKMAA